jgi:hypothetical protein
MKKRRFIIVLATVAVLAGLIYAFRASRAVPAFQIRISLSDQAAKLLSENRETIKGTIYFDGDGSNGIGGGRAPFRNVFLGTYEFELSQPGTVSVSTASISSLAFRRLYSPDYHYTINVYSGRRRLPNNVLNGGYAAGTIRGAAGTTIGIRCDLLALAKTK